MKASGILMSRSRAGLYEMLTISPRGHSEAILAYRSSFSARGIVRREDRGLKARGGGGEEADSAAASAQETFVAEELSSECRCSSSPSGVSEVSRGEG